VNPTSLSLALYQGSVHAVLARFPECRVIRRLGLAVAAAPCHLLLAAVLRCVKNFWPGRLAWYRLIRRPSRFWS